MPGRTPPQGTANSLSAYARLIAVTTLTEMAGRPGVLRGTGPVDPELARYSFAALKELRAELSR